ncbi:Holliday junction branch migration protein RuvA [Thiomicrorhabdus sediminis]|uniref:Holliday junction branch migration complex subunit RuvA n=1 Tax=Thiomicrorhabdus sediminis TaxID=2580412 RepID=A0A4P9K5T2_9GAMM|nr:Holliday junction branch migration protein RuvA [Thiomicrorhabdus sediminis]QCU90394.1 Holliday junction branch migration protein RuvA [Thiomicrorhabdus sediminis]
MIGFLRGQLVQKQPPMLTLDVQGVGYEIEAPMSTFYQLEAINEDVTILTHMHVREDAMLLFGFASESERILFKTLIKVNGVGAKMALGILSAMSVNEFCSHVDQGDVSALTRIPGVGKKTAERLLIEMRDRLKPVVESGVLDYQPAQSSTMSATDPVAPLFNSSVQQSACDALVALGYKANQAEKMVAGAFEEGLTLEAIIKRALQGVKL